MESRAERGGKTPNYSIRNLGLRVAGLAVALCWCVPLSVPASEPKCKPPRTEFGHPDLQGVWNYSSDIPTERPKEFADQEFLTPTDTEKLRVDKAQQFDQVAAIGVGAHSTSFFDFAAQTASLRTSLVVYPAEGHLPKPLEGDTLAIVTKKFTDLTASFNGSGTPHDKTVTERFTRTSATTLKYAATIDDKKTFLDNIVISLPMKKTNARMSEFACHEATTT